MRGQLDVYGEIVVEDSIYAAVYDFTGDIVLINILEGNKDMFWVDGMKALEYVQYTNKIGKQAAEASKAKAVVKPPLGPISYKMDTVFGKNDGTATTNQDHLVLSFAWDDEILQDGSSFRRHLYEHPQIQDLNYGGFDWERMQFNLPLGPGDKGHWADNIDDIDRLKLVDAICNVDNPFFDIKLLRTLVKEYCSTRIENVWWKNMGYEEGKLELMRLKQKEILKQRFLATKANASKTGAKDFRFDGKIYPTGVDPKKHKKEQDDKLKQIQANQGVPPAAPGGTA